MAKSNLVLEDGSVFEGEPFGYKGPAAGEVVFSTGMSGYQESITDPSSKGQIIVMTYPLIGNYGVSDDFYLSERVQAKGLVVRDYCKEPSPMYGGRTLEDLLIKDKVPGITGIDTRELVRKIRTSGTLRGAISSDVNTEALIKELKRTPFPSECNLVGEVSCKKIEKHDFGKGLKIGLLDCGGKSILNDLGQRFDVVVFPYDTPADVILDNKIKGLMISAGPGDPSHPALQKTTVKAVSDLSSQLPIFGTCLGGKIVGIAMGGKTYKMKFGHHGSNQPVKCDGKVYITSQNHCFAMNADSPGKDMTADQVNVNDGSVEGIKHKKLPIFTTEYRPTASLEQWDTSFLYDRFAKAAKEGRK
jgi:carbamoyl-phosphate synthase small subunit